MFLSKLWQSLKALVSRQYKLLKKFGEKAQAAIIIVNLLKEAVESPVADIFVNLIPGDVDQAILSKARAILPEILKDMALAQKIIQQANSNSDVLNSVIEYLRNNFVNSDARKGFWADLAGQLTVALSDGELSWGEAVALAQTIYHNPYRK